MFERSESSDQNTLNATLYTLQGITANTHPGFVNPTYWRCIGHDGTTAVMAKGSTEGGDAQVTRVTGATLTTALASLTAGASTIVADITTQVDTADVLG